MSFSIKAKCQYGELLHRRKTAEAALKKAREMSRAGCYDIYITTPEGRDYHSSEFGDLPRTPVGVVEAARHRTRIVQIVGSGVTGEWTIVAIRPHEQFKNAHRASHVIADKKTCRLRARVVGTKHEQSS